jgi:hypothetical protein
MPSPTRLEEQIYETMRVGKEVLFTFTTGGVKYRAVFQHKEVRYVTLFSNSYLVLNKESDRRVGVSRSETGDSNLSASSSNSQSLSSEPNY